jgi:hypothetical protein
VGKHPRTQNGLGAATTDQGRIRTWWAQWPDANIGILTGSTSGLLVLDVDNKAGRCGRENLAALAGAHGGLPATLTASTGSGEHFFFKHPGEAVKNSAGTLAEGVDVRGERGYVVAAPSLHASGKRYAFASGEQTLAEVPPWLLAKLRPKGERIQTMPKAEINPFDAAPTSHEGERNDTLYKLGCALRGRQGMERDVIAAILLEYNLNKCDPPLNDGEVLLIVDSVCRHPAEFGPKKPAKRMEQNPLYWFPFNTRDFFADQDIQVMEDFQLGWWIRLRVSAWLNGGFLPADTNRLWRLARAKSKKAFESRCDLVLSEYEQVNVDEVPKLKHPHLAAAYADKLQEWNKKREAGEASRAARLAEAKNTPPSPNATSE